jgi:nanoRNase/pAp phosphatase (c-di-AMP/oligoRNAs hydrolase)
VTRPGNKGHRNGTGKPNGRNGNGGRNGAGRSANGAARSSGAGRLTGVRSSPVLQRPARVPGSAAVLARFGRIFGKRFTRNNLEVLAQVHMAYSGLKRSAGAIRGRGANIYTQWVGDPDALGSAVMLQAVLNHLGAREVRILTGTLGHPQNRYLVQKCGIVLNDPNRERLPGGLNCMVDTSPPLGMSNTGPVEPVDDYFFVSDHHADPEEVERNCRENGVKRVKHAFVGLPVGSTSSFMTALAMAFGVVEDLGPAGRAAAALGIYTDTSALLHGANPLDFRMFEKLTRDAATQDMLDELRDYRVPPEWFLYRAAATQNMETTGAVRVAAAGYVREELRDVIAEMANDMLRIEGTSIAIVVAVTDIGTEVSVRADSRLIGGDRQRIVRVIEELLGYAFPGVSGFKYERIPPHRVEGGACVPHDESEQRLWKTVTSGNVTDAAAALTQSRACARAIVAALRDLKFARPDEIQGLL